MSFSELEREANIARNRAILEQLELKQAVEDLGFKSKSQPPPKPKATPPTPKTTPSTSKATPPPSPPQKKPTSSPKAPAATASTSKTPVSNSSTTVDSRFTLLVTVLREFRNSGNMNPGWSIVGTELLKRDAKVYKKAGVGNKLSKFLELAQANGVVELGNVGTNGAWIKLSIA